MNLPKRKRSVIAFTDALCKLVSDAPLNKIAVTAICDEAGYTPMAFYSNFENKYDFVNSIIDFEAQIFSSFVFNRLEQKVPLDRAAKSWEDLHCQYITDFFEHVAKNRALYHCILYNLFVPDGITLLSRRIAQHMTPYLTLLTDRCPEMPNFTTFFLEITEAQMLMVVRYWLSKIPDSAPRSVAELYCRQFLFRTPVPLDWDPESGLFSANL